MQLSRPELEDELERRGEPAPPEATLSDLEDRLVEHLIRERSADDDVAQLEGVESAPQGDMPRFELHSATHMLLTPPTPRLRVAVIAGGPSAEAPVSLESARTVLDMLRTRPHPEQAAQLGVALMQVRSPLRRPFSGRAGVGGDLMHTLSDAAALTPASSLNRLTLLSCLSTVMLPAPVSHCTFSAPTFTPTSVPLYQHRRGRSLHRHRRPLL